jgi:hypothetical protein
MEPLKVSVKGHGMILHILTTQTLRVEWIPGCYPDIMAYIMDEGLGDAVLEDVPLEDTPSGHINRIKGSIMVDLAVVDTELHRVRDHFRCTSLPLNDLSLINIPRGHNWLRSFWVYSAYLRRSTRAIESGNTPIPVLEWYGSRLEEVSTAMIRNR